MHYLKAALTSVILLFSTAGLATVLGVWTLEKAVLRGSRKAKVHQRMDRIIIAWTSINRRTINVLNLVQAKVHWHNRPDLSPNQWYLVISNHQTWTDILLLQTYLLDDIPPLKFFTKAQLIWIPFLGLAMKALGFPYVKRVTRKQVKQDPELRFADRDNVRKACEGFKNHPTSVLNFLEGTRNTADKHEHQRSEFTHLLRPKVGGINYIIDGMGQHLHRLVDVTIVYHDGVPSFTDFLQGKCGRVEIDVKSHPVPDLSNITDDSARKAAVAKWLHTLWQEKDQLIGQLTHSTQPNQI